VVRLGLAVFNDSSAQARARGGGLAGAVPAARARARRLTGPSRRARLGERGRGWRPQGHGQARGPG
jgi:hypothetical protein